MTNAIVLKDEETTWRKFPPIVGMAGVAVNRVKLALDQVFYFVARKIVGRCSIQAILSFATPYGNTTDEEGRVTGVWCAVYKGGNEFQIDMLLRCMNGIVNKQAVVHGGFGRHRRNAAAMAMQIAGASPLTPVDGSGSKQSGFGISWICFTERNGEKSQCLQHPALHEVNRLISKNFPKIRSLNFHLHQEIKLRHAPAMQSFADTLDRAAFEFVAKFTKTPHLYDSRRTHTVNERMRPILDKARVWSGLDATITDGAPLLKRMLTHPLHAEALAAAWSYSPHDFTADPVETLRKGLSNMVGLEVNRAVAAGLIEFHETLQNAVDESFSGGLDLHLLRRDDGPQMLATVLADLLSKLPRDWTPKDATEWASLARIVDPLRIAMKYFAVDVSAAAFVNSKGRWTETSERLARLLGAQLNELPVILKNAVADAMDMVNAFARQVTKPALVLARGLPLDVSDGDGVSASLYLRMNDREIGKDDELSSAADALALRLLLRGRSLGRILELSDKWHANQTRMDEDIESISPRYVGLRRWKAGLPDWESDGILLKVLTSQNQMKDEGSRVKNADGSDGLDHCVGGYASKCACSRTRVVSLRKRADDGREARISTAEIDMDRRNAVVVQHRGRKNGPPPADAETALSKYLAAISDGTLAVDLASIEPTREHAGETIADAAGYEWHVPGNVEKAWSAWSAFLPRAARTWNATDVAEYVKQASAEAVEGSIA